MGYGTRVTVKAYRTLYVNKYESNKIFFIKYNEFLHELLNYKRREVEIKL